MSAAVSDLPLVGLPPVDPVTHALGRLEADTTWLFLARELAALAPALGSDERRALILLTLALHVGLRDGHTQLPAGEGSEARRARQAQLASLGASPDEQLAVEALLRTVAHGTHALGHLFAPPHGRAPFVVGPDFVAIERVYRAEARVARALARRLSAPAHTPAPRPTAEAATSLTDEQRSAVEQALTRALTVVTGGPGTGKTSVVRAIVESWIVGGGAPEAVAIAAPTGKAANRLAQALGATVAFPAPVTLHRLLGYHPGRGVFRHHRGDPVSARLVIVDEASMIDLFVMDRLLDALAPEASLVLLGDAHQLPSVDAGAVFRELATRGVTLTRSFRMNPTQAGGHRLAQVAAAVNAGDPLFTPGQDLVQLRVDVAALTFTGVEVMDTASTSTRTAFLDAWFTRWLAPGQTDARDRPTAALDHVTQGVLRIDDQGLARDDASGVASALRHHERFRLLAVTRTDARATGAAALNASLHARAWRAWRARYPDSAVRPTDWLAGEPVIVLRNDPDRGLANGDQGLLVRARATFLGSGAQLFAVFPSPDGPRAFPLESLRADLELGYALTVHRAQGSEHDEVALILPDEDLPLLTRPIVYTALTRARHGTVILGRRDLLVRAIERALPRHASLGVLLDAALAGAS